MEITSINNELVKETVKLQQKKYRTERFLIEGEKCVKEAFDSGIEILYAFVLNEKKYSYLGDKIILTKEPVMKKISTTDSPPEIMAVGIKKVYTFKDLKHPNKVVLLENIKDLGNLGTILRTSSAFNADAVILYGECADMYNPKCVRATAGNLWKIPVIYVDKFEVLKKEFSSYERIAALPLAKTNLNDFNAKKPMLVMFGSEAHGLSDELVKFSTKQVKIEMSESVESLNLSISTAIVLYKLFL